MSVQIPFFRIVCFTSRWLRHLAPPSVVNPTLLPPKSKSCARPWPESCTHICCAAAATNLTYATGTNTYIVCWYGCTRVCCHYRHHCHHHHHHQHHYWLRALELAPVERARCFSCISSWLPKICQLMKGSSAVRSLSPTHTQTHTYNRTHTQSDDEHMSVECDHKAPKTQS